MLKYPHSIYINIVGVLLMKLFGMYKVLYAIKIKTLRNLHVVVVVGWLNQSYRRLSIQDSRVLEVLSPPLGAIGASFLKRIVVEERIVVENLKGLPRYIYGSWR